jgi:hypothetical protein
MVYPTPLSGRLHICSINIQTANPPGETSVAGAINVSPVAEFGSSQEMDYTLQAQTGAQAGTLITYYTAAKAAAAGIPIAITTGGIPTGTLATMQLSVYATPN